MFRRKNSCNHAWFAHHAKDVGWVAVRRHESCDFAEEQTAKRAERKRLHGCAAHSACPACDGGKIFEDGGVVTESRDVSGKTCSRTRDPHEWASLSVDGSLNNSLDAVVYCVACRITFPIRYEVLWGWISGHIEEVRCSRSRSFVRANARYLRLSKSESWVKMFRVWPDGRREFMKAAGYLQALGLPAALAIEAELIQRQQQHPDTFFSSTPAPLEVNVDETKSPVPRSPRKIAAMEERATRHEVLFHDADPRDSLSIGGEGEVCPNGRMLLSNILRLCGSSPPLTRQERRRLREAQHIPFWAQKGHNP